MVTTTQTAAEIYVTSRPNKSQIITHLDELKDGIDTVESVASSNKTPEFYRADPNVVEAGEVEQAVVQAITDGQRIVRIDTDYTAEQVITDRNKVVFTGTGSFTGTNADTANYRRQVIPEGTPCAQAFPDVAMPITMPKTGGVAVVVGDSKTTFAADSASAGYVLTEILEKKLKSDNPDFDFEVIGRGIGATRWSDLDGVVGGIDQAAYPWYDNLTKPWLDYVEDLAPDVVFLQHGINDRWLFDPDNVDSVVAKILAWAKVPQIVFITNMVPTMSDIYGTFEQQESRDQNAGYVRTLARTLGCLCIDLNRTFNLVRDGRDVMQHYLVEQPEVTFANPSQFLATDDQQCRAAMIEFTVPDSAFTNSNPMAVVTGAGDSNLLFIDDQGGKVRLRTFKGQGNPDLSEITDIDTPVGDSTWQVHIDAYGIGIRRVDNQADNSNDPYTMRIARSGGLFAPRVFYNSSGGAGPCLSAKLFMGVDRPYMPFAFDDLIWGDGEADGNDDGNDINHESSIGSMQIIGTHFAANTYKMVEPFLASEAVNAVHMAAVDGSDAIAGSATVDGTRLTRCNTIGDLAGTTMAAGTLWQCQGDVPATAGVANRITTWQRVS